MMLSKHLILCHRLLLLPSVFPSIRIFSKESAIHIRLAKVLELQLQHQSFQWTFRLISFRMDWLNLLAVQGTLKHLLQHHSSKASILWHSVFFMVQPWHLYVTTGKITALTQGTLVDKVLSLLFNMLSRLAITFLPRSKLSFNFMAAVTICSDFGVQENKVCHCFQCLPIYLPWSNGIKCHDLSFLNVEF